MIEPARGLNRLVAVSRELMTLARNHVTLTGLAIALGIALRLIDFGMDRQPWKDELALAENVVGRPIFQFDRPLVQEQLAPPGYLLAVRVSDRLIGHSWFALRSSSLVCSIAGLFAAASLARRRLSPRAVPIALLLMAVSDDLIYYSGEFKQYSADILIALGAAGLAGVLADRKLRPGLALAAALYGSLAVWTSYPATFVLATAGSWLGLRAILARDYRRLAVLIGVGACWLANFAACYAVSRRLLGSSDWMWNWWGFAFLPWPPRGWTDASRWFWTFANLPVNPGGLDTPFTPVGTGLLGLALALLGFVRIAVRRDWGALVLLCGPFVPAIAASVGHRYPFHGRLLLFLTPNLLMLIAEGMTWSRRRFVRVALIGAFLIVPLERWFVIPQMHSIRNVDSHGDQRNDLLDYRERYEGSG